VDALPPWPLVESMLRTLVLPAFATAAVVLTIVCLATKSANVRMIGGAAALIAGLTVGNYFRDLLEWWPVEPAAETEGVETFSRGWPALLHVTAFAVGLSALATFLSVRVHYFAGLALRVLVAAGSAWWLTEALPPFSRERTMAVIFAGMILNWEALLFATGGSARRMSLMALTVPWGAAAALVLIFAHSARFSDLAVLMLAALCGADLISALWKLETSSLAGGPAVFFPALLLAGAANTYSEVPAAAFACVAFAPCALWLLLPPPLLRLSARAVTFAAVMAVSIPCAAGVVMAARVEKLEFGETE
jgi:hypothetical protein